jgi:hypothetical protein
MDAQRSYATFAIGTGTGGRPRRLAVRLVQKRSLKLVYSYLEEVAGLRDMMGSMYHNNCSDLSPVLFGDNRDLAVGWLPVRTYLHVCERR